MGGYLDILDEILCTGIDAFSAEFLHQQAAFVLDRQQPDGGFTGRRGVSDPYYTDFAVRTLALAKYRGTALGQVGEYLTALPAEPGDIITLFNRLNAARLLQQAGTPVAARVNGLAILSRYCPPAGGFSRPGGDSISAYQTFLAALCYELAGQHFPSPNIAATALANLQCLDGGFCEIALEHAGQTNATAAALAFLRMQDALDEAVGEGAIAFLAQMQGADGGIRAHAAAGESDLLSTFTGLLTLAGLDAADCIDLAGVARFTRESAVPDGGFRACRSDDEPDIEYTYYGLATLALLRAHLAAQA